MWGRLGLGRVVTDDSPSKEKAWVYKSYDLACDFNVDWRLYVSGLAAAGIFKKLAA
jgi:hypothetical protein